MSTNVAAAIESRQYRHVAARIPEPFQSAAPAASERAHPTFGEAATGVQRALFRSRTNSFRCWSIRSGPIAVAPNRSHVARPAGPMLLKAPSALAAAAPQLSVWGAAYGSTTATDGDPQGVGSHDLTVHTSGFATGIDDRIGPYTTVGFAVAGGGTSWSLSAGLGGGHSDVFQAGIYGSRQFGAAYLSGALAYGSHWASTSRTVTLGGGGELNADFNGQSFSGRLEAGYQIISSMPIGLSPMPRYRPKASPRRPFRERRGGRVSVRACLRCADCRRGCAARSEPGRTLRLPARAEPSFI